MATPIKKPNKLSNTAQHREFVEIARDLGCHEDEAKFKETLRKIGAQKPKRDKPKRKP